MGDKHWVDYAQDYEEIEARELQLQQEYNLKKKELEELEKRSIQCEDKELPYSLKE